MSGFDKIEFDHKDKMTNKKKATKFKYTKKVGVALLVVVVILLLVAIPTYATYQSGLKTYREAKILSSALKSQDLELASTQVDKTKEALKETQQNLHYLMPLKFVPIMGWYYNDADHLMSAGEHALDSAKVSIEAVKPYSDVLGLKGEGSFTGGSAEDRIRTTILAMSKITPKIDDISDSLSKVKTEIDQVNPDHYPPLIFGNKIQQQLKMARDLADSGAVFVTDAKPLVKVLPSLLGESEEKRYLILFQNDKELRSTGGFITAYAYLTVNKGVIKVEKSEDIYSLDNSIPNKGRAPAPIVKYLGGVSTFNLRDSNLSPDYVESMDTFLSMYKKSPEKKDIDGIIAMDTSVLVSTIKILDDQVTAGGLTFTTKNDPRCDCPQVIYLLEDNISRPVNYIKTERKGLLGDLLQALMTKALSSSPKVYWGPLFQTFIAEANQKHVMFYIFNEDAQNGIEALNAAGRIKDFDGDYFHLNDTSFSGAKVNIFLQQEVESNYEVANDGTITKTVTVNYKNPYPASDCNLERGGLCLNAVYKDWFRVYVPEGSKLVDSKGSQVKVTTYEELGKTVFDGFVTVRPKGATTLTLTYTLPFKWSDSQLPILIQKQPGTSGDKYTMNVNGNTKETFDLSTDKEFKVRK